MIWTGIPLDGHTLFHHFERDTLTLVRYRNEVLGPYVCLSTGAVFPNTILMDVNTRHIELNWSMNFWKVRIFDQWRHHPYRACLRWRTTETCNSPLRTIQGLKAKLLNECD
ncbi:hypothetical protein TNCV_4934001 [Trichonephila clavipes]|nr:hypothetical protein TNCV_4934001 [Trichonephila clavipes]